MKQTKPAQAMELRSLSPVFDDFSGKGMVRYGALIDARHPWCWQV
jgi:hypothetical protein